MPLVAEPSADSAWLSSRPTAWELPRSCARADWPGTGLLLSPADSCGEAGTSSAALLSVSLHPTILDFQPHCMAGGHDVACACADRASLDACCPYASCVPTLAATQMSSICSSACNVIRYASKLARASLSLKSSSRLSACRVVLPSHTNSTHQEGQAGDTHDVAGWATLQAGLGVLPGSHAMCKPPTVCSILYWLHAGPSWLGRLQPTKLLHKCAPTRSSQVCQNKTALGLALASSWPGIEYTAAAISASLRTAWHMEHWHRHAGLRRNSPDARINCALLLEAAALASMQ